MVSEGGKGKKKKGKKGGIKLLEERRRGKGKMEGVELRLAFSLFASLIVYRSWERGGEGKEKRGRFSGKKTKRVGKKKHKTALSTHIEIFCAVFPKICTTEEERGEKGKGKKRRRKKRDPARKGWGERGGRKGGWTVSLSLALPSSFSLVQSGVKKKKKRGSAIQEKKGGGGEVKFRVVTA